MGLFWDLIQQNQISSQSSRSDSLEQRVASLEHQVEATNKLLSELLTRLEHRFGEDLNRDGKVG